MEPTWIERVVDVKLVGDDQIEATFIGRENYGFIVRMARATLLATFTEIERLQSIRQIERGDI